MIYFQSTNPGRGRYGSPGGLNRTSVSGRSGLDLLKTNKLTPTNGLRRPDIHVRVSQRFPIGGRPERAYPHLTSMVRHGGCAAPGRERGANRGKALAGEWLTETTKIAKVRVPARRITIEACRCCWSPPTKWAGSRSAWLRRPRGCARRATTSRRPTCPSLRCPARRWRRPA